MKTRTTPRLTGVADPQRRVGARWRGAVLFAAVAIAYALVLREFFIGPIRTDIGLNQSYFVADVLFVGGNVFFGFVVGRWPALLLPFLLLTLGHYSAEGYGYLVSVFFPMAFGGVALGLAIRRLPDWWRALTEELAGHEDDETPTNGRLL
jgi:hypothetical protein